MDGQCLTINCDGILDTSNTVNDCGFCEGKFQFFQKFVFYFLRCENLCKDDIYTCNVDAGQRIIKDCQNQAITPVIPPDAYDLLMSKGLTHNF